MGRWATRKHLSLGRLVRTPFKARTTTRHRVNRGATLARIAGVLGSLFAAHAAKAIDVPEDRAEAMIHVYRGGGITASGPALLIRKKVADSLSVSGTYYIDAVSNASIDVVTTASPYKERRTEYGLSVDHAVRDALITVSLANSTEPDYIAHTFGADVAQEVFGGMTTISMGFTRGADQVGKHGYGGFFDTAHHWRYRLGATQILTPRWLLSANYEAVSDEGYLGSPYRVARVFGASVSEKNPRTRSSRALKFGTLAEVMPGVAVHADYRYFWDNWDIKAHTFEVGASRYFGTRWLADAHMRFYSQGKALFYSDNAQAETTYVSRNRLLSTFTDMGLGANLSYTCAKVPGKYDIKLNAAYDLVRYSYKDFTDIRTGSPYSFDSNVIQLFVTATF
jgi:hypothetical protein